MVDRQHRPGGKTGSGALPDWNVNIIYKRKPI